MANWKKMAEAFGRASVRDNNSKSGRQFIKDAASQHAPNTTSQSSKEPRTWEQIRKETANQPATDEIGRAFRKGQVEGQSRNVDVANELAETPDAAFMDVSERADDVASDKRLEDEFVKEFKAAASRHGDTGDDAEFASSIREIISDLKSRGISESDILNTLKGE